MDTDTFAVPPPYVEKTRWEKFLEVLRDLKALAQFWWDKCAPIHKPLAYLVVIPMLVLFSLLVTTLCVTLAKPMYTGVRLELVAFGNTIGDGVASVGHGIENGLSSVGDVFAAPFNYVRSDADQSSISLADYAVKQGKVIETIDGLDAILMEGDSDMMATFIPHEALLGLRSKIRSDPKEQDAVRNLLLGIKTVVSKLKPLRSAWFPKLDDVQASIGQYLDHVIEKLEAIENKIDIALKFTDIAMARLEPVSIRIDAIADHFFRSTLKKEPTSRIGMVIRNVFEVFGYKEKPRFIDPLVRRNLTRSQQALEVLGGMSSRLIRARHSVEGLRKAVLEFRSSTMEDKVTQVTLEGLDNFIAGMEATGKLWADQENLYEKRQHESQADFMSRLKEVCSREQDKQMSLCGLVEDEIQEGV